MQNIILRIFVTGLLMATGSAEAAGNLIKAGADSSGGGKSVVCREPGTHRILSIEMLDLFEGRAMFGLEPLAMGTSLDEVIESAKAKFLHTVENADRSIFPDLDRLKQKIRILPPGSRLEPVDDASPIVLPRGCDLEQAAVWVDKSLVMADRELWEAMDARNQGALIVHEVIYNWTRYEGEKNSRRARKIVAHVFSQFNFEGVKEGVPEKSQMCATTTPDQKLESFFWIYPNHAGQLVAQFTKLRGTFLFGKTKTTFSSIKFSPSEQKENVAEWQSLESNFETDGFFGLMSRPIDGGRSLVAIERDETGKQVELPILCFDMQ